MKNILNIGHTDFRIFIRKRSAWIWLFVGPLAFIYFMGLANHPGHPANWRAPVLTVNQDTNFLGRLFLDEMGAQGMRQINPTNGESPACIIRIPCAPISSRKSRPKKL